MHGGSRFGARLLALRRQQNLTQRQLSSRSEVAISTISELEHGIKTPGVDTAAALDRALGAGGELAALVDRHTRRPPQRPVPGGAIDHPFGVRLRQLRDERGWGLRRLASMVPCTHTHIAQMERGERAPSPTTAARLDEVLGAGGELVALAAGRDAAKPAQDLITDEVVIGREGDMDRRSVLAALVGVPSVIAFGADPASAAVTEALRHDLTTTLGGHATDVAEWEEIVRNHCTTYDATPPTAMVEDLRVDLLVAQARLDTLTDGTAKRTMQGVIGMLSVLMALTVSNLGDTRSGYRWWRTARSFADASRDNGTQVWVRGKEIVRGLYEGRQLAALEMADEAAAISKTVDLGTVEVLSGRAQALAMLGREAEAVTALSRVNDAVERLPAAVVEDEYPLFGFSEWRLRHTESYVYTYVGDWRRAGQANDRALSLYPDDLFRPRSMVELHAAMRLVGTGEPAAGADHARRVVQQLPDEQRTGPVLELARQVADAVPLPEQRRPQVTDLREVLALPAAP